MKLENKLKIELNKMKRYEYPIIMTKPILKSYAEKIYQENKEIAIIYKNPPDSKKEDLYVVCRKLKKDEYNDWDFLQWINTHDRQMRKKIKDYNKANGGQVNGG